MTTTFHISAQYRQLLEQNGLDNFEALFGYEHGLHVDGHRDRNVTKLELRDDDGRPQVFYLKREWNPKAALLVRRMLAEGLRFPPSRSMKEWRNLHALRRREIGTAEPVAVGEYRRNGFFNRALLLVREVENEVNLAEYFNRDATAPLSNADRRALAMQAAAMIRKMHDRGMAFNDLYAKHLYVDPSRPGGSFRPTLIDAQRVRRFWHMMPTARWHDLAALYVTSMVAGCRRTDRLKFLLAYSRQSRLSPAVKLMVRRIVSRGEKIRGRGFDPQQTVSRWQAPAGMIPINELNIKYIDKHRIMVAERYLPELRRLELDTVERVMDFGGGKSYREKAGRQTVRIEIVGSDGRPSALYLKRHRQVDRRDWLDGLMYWRKPRTRAEVEYRNIVQLYDSGIASATPVAVGQDLRWSLVQDSFLMTEEIPDAEPADDYLRSHFALLTGADERDSAAGAAQGVAGRRLEHLWAKRRLIAELGRTARKFHESGFYHRDFYLCHFFVREVVPQPDVIGSPPSLEADASQVAIEPPVSQPLPGFCIHLIDLQRVRFPGPGRVGRRWIVKDLASLNYSAPAGIITRSDKLRFVRHYTGLRKIDGRTRDLLRAVQRKTQRIARHDRNMQMRGET